MPRLHVMTLNTPWTHAPGALPEELPNQGDLVQLRSRRWLVDAVEVPDQMDPTGANTPGSPGATVVRLACAEDDAQGEELSVYWEYEPDRRIVRSEGWERVGERGFDDPRTFAAFLNTLRWSSVTATDSNLFQAPFRAGIKIDAYQMEPLRKALRLPRVNLFIADDTGLGKTIEAGLIARELLLRKRCKTIVVAAPPSVLEQWKAELEERFGLTFEILDRAYVARVRRERGFGVNPWATHSRFLVSHSLLIDPAYTDPMRAWLGELAPGSLLILDEAHHAAPSSGGRYGIETKFTRAVRDLSGRFEHRLFLSATPHNGHSNSFSTLLELLDPYRFTRGVKIKGKRDLEAVMVRRLKEDIRAIQGGFPQREVVRIAIDNLPPGQPELLLSRLLDEYREVHEQRFAQASKRTQASAGLLIVGLQQRLLSSIEAFAQSLEVHRRALERRAAATATDVETAIDETPPASAFSLTGLTTAPGPDDEAIGQSDDELLVAEQQLIEAATAGVEAGLTDEPRSDAGARDARRSELLDQMQTIADRSRDQPDAKALHLIDWIREHMCPDLPAYGKRPADGGTPPWNDRRVLIFTESREGTKRWLHQILEQAIACTDRAEERIEVITGLTSGPRRQEVQRRFNTPPAEDPLRILIATDAAREGLNFQAHCADLFHFDLPWNPGRIEQRNGRIDRKLQPADQVRCHYFVLPQRFEDRVLDVLVKKTETIRRELGSLSKVIDDEIERGLRHGIRHSDANRLAEQIEQTDLPADRKQLVGEELEEARERQDELREQIDTCRTLLERSRQWVAFDERAFRDALSRSLELLGADSLQTRATRAPGGPVKWQFPALDRCAGADPTWAATLDTLRTPRPRDEKLLDWRRNAPVRPVVFEDQGVLTEDTVHLHLEQRVAQRLLGRFRSQGFVHHDLSRACLAQVADSIPRVVLLGRLTLYGAGAERLHEVLVAVAARWVDPNRRDGPLSPYAREAEQRALELLEASLNHDGDRATPKPTTTVTERLLASATRDVEELLGPLEVRAADEASRAQDLLSERGRRESEQLRDILTRQRERVRSELGRHSTEFDQLTLAFAEEERRQLEANMRAWERRLGQFDADLETEPARIERFYEIRARRVEPVGLVYLWPDTN